MTVSATRRGPAAYGRGTIALVASVLALDTLSRFDPALVERFYSRGFYPGIAAVLATLTGWFPRSVAETLLVGTLAILPLGVRAVLRRLRARETSLRRRLGRVLGDGLWWAAFVYGAFLLVWGINYRRLPYATIAGLSTRPAMAGELRSLCEALVREANELRGGLPEDAGGVMRLPGGRGDALGRAWAGFSRASETLPVFRFRTSAPKPVFFSTTLSYLGITGIYVPFTAEANVNATLPDPDLPFTASHELAHAHGFAREDEANYLGYLACRFHPDRDFRYSGVLTASLYAASALAGVDREEHWKVETARSAAVRRDVAALRVWSERYRGRVSRASQAINHAYLRSQGAADGVRSYGRMVDLLLAERRSPIPGLPTKPGEPPPP